MVRDMLVPLLLPRPFPTTLPPSSTCFSGAIILLGIHSRCQIEKKKKQNKTIGFHGCLQIQTIYWAQNKCESTDNDDHFSKKKRRKKNYFHTIPFQENKQPFSLHGFACQASTFKLLRQLFFQYFDPSEERLDRETIFDRSKRPKTVPNRF